MPEANFVADSLLEERRFEPSVPPLVAWLLHLVKSREVGADAGGVDAKITAPMARRGARVDATCRGVGLDDRPAHLLRCRERNRERLLGRERERQRGKIRITAFLQGSGFGSRIGRGVTVLRFAQLDYGDIGRGLSVS